MDAAGIGTEVLRRFGDLKGEGKPWLGTQASRRERGGVRDRGEVRRGNPFETFRRERDGVPTIIF